MFLLYREDFEETPLDKAYVFYEKLKARITNRFFLTG